SLNLYQKFVSNAPAPDPHDRAGAIIQKMDEKMHLSQAQKDQIRQVLESTRDRYADIRKNFEPVIKQYEPQFDALRQQSRCEIRAVLTDKQLPEFEKIIEEQDRDRERMQQEEKERRKK